MSQTTAVGLHRREVDRQRPLPGHAERRRIDEEIGAREPMRQLAPGGRGRPAAEARRQRLGALGRAVDDGDALEAVGKQGVDDRARRAAGAQHDGGPGRAPPAGAPSSRLARKPATSVLSPQSAPSWRHRVLTAPEPSASPASRSHAANAASLCGTVTLAPTKDRGRSRRRTRRTRPAARRNARRRPRSRAPSANIHGSSASANAPPASRRRRRAAHQGAHSASAPSARRQASSFSIGNPRIVA